jgi:putative glycosyltransferase (TIGR04348 family)
MKICLITPAAGGTRHGNRITALRWARILRELGHRVVLEQQYEGGSGDLMIALHARKSFPSAERFHREHPDRPLVVVLTGTDVYQDLPHSPEAWQSLEWATRIIALQSMAPLQLPSHLRERARVIYQSATASNHREPPRKSAFEVCVLGHLRPVKDPFRAAEAARLLPASSRLRVLHFGAALSPDMAERARAEEASNPRYRWLGDRPRWQALRLLARSRLLVLSSILEGGANVVSEALAASVPVLSSHIPGSIGILGPDYPGYFPVGGSQELADLLYRTETVPEFYSKLQAWCEQLKPLVDPVGEQQSWENLLRELARWPA